MRAQSGCRLLSTYPLILLFTCVPELRLKLRLRGVFAFQKRLFLENKIAVSLVQSRTAPPSREERRVSLPRLILPGEGQGRLHAVTPVDHGDADSFTKAVDFTSVSGAPLTFPTRALF